MEADGPLYRRWWKVCLFPGCCLPCNAVLHPCRASVSQNKTRYEQDGFDLDLTYVTSRIIVHGFPATGIEHIYRNPRTEVQRLLDKYHKDHYKVYNFANEAGRTYPDQLFQGRVERFPFTDHTCPPLESVVNFCESAKAWLDMDEENVVSLHCKAGKGRAGIMTACLMIRLGATATDAVSKYDATRVSDLKGLTVVNQRKWPFMYERLVKEVWGVQDSIGMVPGQDPDLRAPTLRATCLREISIQLQPQTAGSKSSSSFLPNLSCSIYQQEPMGKTLVHRAKMVEVAPKEGEPESVLAAVLPRSVVVKGTFQVLVRAAGTVSTQKRVIDLWWNTTFLAADGGDHTFQLSEMDVSPLRLAGRLHQANAKLGVLHTQPHAESPRRRRPLKSRAGTSRSGDAGSTSATVEGEGAPGSGTGVPPPQDSGDSRLGAADQSLPHVAPEKGKGGDAIVGSNGGEGDGRADAVVPAASKSGGSSAGGGIPSGGSGVASATTDVASAVGVEGREGVPSGHVAPTFPVTSSVTNSNQDALTGDDSSPSLPGPSPAGMISPVWTFEGRTPLNNVEPAAKAAGDNRWTRSRMWPSNQGMSSADTSSPQPKRSASFKMHAPEDELREKRRLLQQGQPGSRSMDSLGNSGGSTSAPTGTSSSMPWVAGGGGDRRRAAPSNGKSYTMPSQQRGLTDSESDDQLAVGASAFEGGGLGPRGPMGAPPSVQGAQWAMEMEMAFAQERRRWEEHQHCLETELDWALAARARAEARSEENAARAEVLEGRLTAWRSEYSVIECDVKQAVGLLEMSLSGLVSAESALKRWKGAIPAKAYEDILACLTKGDVAHSTKT